MERSTVTRITLAALVATGLSACAASQQLAQGIADKAPFARPPEIVKVGARKWEGDTNYYNSGGGFEFVVKHGLANELLVKENGVDLARVYGVPTPSATAKTVFWRAGSVADDTTAQTTTERVRIFTKEAQAPGAFMPPADGTARTYSFVEQSINPRATGKDKLSDPTTVNVMVWNRKPIIARFNTSPSNPATNVPLTIDWRVNDAKKVDLIERLSVTKPDGTPDQRESVIESKVFNPGPAGSIEGSRTLNVTPDTIAIVLRGYSAGGHVVTDVKEVTVSGPVSCPQNPNGRKTWYEFCLECTGRPPEGISEPACTEEEALAEANKWFKSEFCEVKNKACYAP